MRLGSSTVTVYVNSLFDGMYPSSGKCNGEFSSTVTTSSGTICCNVGVLPVGMATPLRVESSSSESTPVACDPSLKTHVFTAVTLAAVASAVRFPAASRLSTIGRNDAPSSNKFRCSTASILACRVEKYCTPSAASASANATRSCGASSTSPIVNSTLENSMSVSGTNSEIVVSNARNSWIGRSSAGLVPNVNVPAASAVSVISNNSCSLPKPGVD